MNAFAARGVEASLGRHVRKPRPGKRPRHFVAGFIGSCVAFILFVRNYYHREEDAVWIWMGMRSDSRCGRDYGTEYVKDTTCGKGSCCSSHGWCGTTEEYCSVALGCQNGCWKVDEAEQKKIDAKHAQADDDSDYRGHMDDDGGDYHHKHRGYRYDDDQGGGYRGSHNRYRGHDDDDHHDYNHRYDEDPDLHAEDYPGDHGDHHDGDHHDGDHHDGDYEHYGDNGEHDHHGDEHEEHHALDEDHGHYEDDEHDDHHHHDDPGDHH